jgi:hypothetical protein
MRTALTAALLLSLAVAAPPAEADEFLADFTGFDWTWPIPNQLDAVGQYYELNSIVGTVNPVYLTFDFTNNEYTLLLGDDLFYAGADHFGTTTVAHYTNGKIWIVEDSRAGGTAATYDLNGDCDPFFDRLTFIDGTVVLSGVFTAFDIIFDTVTGDGNLVGVTNWNGGTQLGNIPLGQRNGWTFGATGIRPGTMPCGYHWQVDGNCVLESPVPVQKTTWGAIKSLDR